MVASAEEADLDAMNKVGNSSQQLKSYWSSLGKGYSMSESSAHLSFLQKCIEGRKGSSADLVNCIYRKDIALAKKNNIISDYPNQLEIIKRRYSWLSSEAKSQSDCLTHSSENYCTKKFINNYWDITISTLNEQAYSFLNDL